MMDFGNAIKEMKKGNRVKRAVWDKEVFVALQPGYPSGIFPNENTRKTWNLSEDELFKCMPYFQIKNSDNTHSMYLFSNEDVLANDWSLI